MKTLIISLALSLIASFSFGQTAVQLKFNHFLGDNGFSMNSESANNIGSKFNVNRLQYYISKISIVHDEGTVTEVSDVYILVNASQSTAVDLGNFDITNVEAINFSVGVNTPQNNQNPAQWPSSHALAPKNPSMHWGWSAGYRFVAMEGKAGESLSTTYEIHALGNSNYHDISIPTGATDDNGTLVIEINADYNRAIEDIDVTKGPISHGEINQAAQLLRNFRDYVFTSTDGQGNTLASVRDQKLNAARVYPNPSNGAITVQLGEESDLADEYIVYDMSGKVIATEAIANSRKIEIVIEADGLYFIELRNSGNAISRSKVSIVK